MGAYLPRTIPIQTNWYDACPAPQESADCGIYERAFYRSPRSEYQRVSGVIEGTSKCTHESSAKSRIQVIRRTRDSVSGFHVGCPRA
jgi:hypothetical protein